MASAKTHVKRAKKVCRYEFGLSLYTVATSTTLPQSQKNVFCLKRTWTNIPEVIRARLLSWALPTFTPVIPEEHLAPRVAEIRSIKTLTTVKSLIADERPHQVILYNRLSVHSISNPLIARYN